jgi:hypothetical protein
MNDWADPHCTSSTSTGERIYLAEAGPPTAGLLAVADAEEYRPDLGVSDESIGEHDSVFLGGKGGERIKRKMEHLAGEVHLDPGLLAAGLLAETTRSGYSFEDGIVIGTDSYYELRNRIEKHVPTAERVHIVGHRPVTTEMGNTTEIATFGPGEGMLAGAKYLKYGEEMVREAFNHPEELMTKGKTSDKPWLVGVEFDLLDVEVRFALTRLWVNPGPKGYKHWLKEVLMGHDILVRTGSSEQNKHHPQRGATIVAARAIHLSQKIFGVKLK